MRNIYTPKESAKRVVAGNQSESIGIAALIESELVGSVDTFADTDELRISCLAVHPDFRQRGVARSLLIHAEQLARESNCPKMTLYTIKETGNVEIFKRLGFSIVAETIADWCTSENFSILHEVQMTKHCG